MADVNEVGQALATLIAGIAYPSGTTQPSITGAPILVYQGWPNSVQLTDDLKAGKVHISVFPQPGDTVTSVACGDEDWEEQSNNGTQGVSIRELRRQTRRFQITIWASCFDKRDPVAKAIDSGLAAVYRLAMPDGSQAMLSYVNSIQDDNSQKQGVYRRDLFYSVNYATTQVENEYTIKEIDTSFRRVADAADSNSASLGNKVTVVTTATGTTITISP